MTISGATKFMVQPKVFEERFQIFLYKIHSKIILINLVSNHMDMGYPSKSAVTVD